MHSFALRAGNSLLASLLITSLCAAGCTRTDSIKPSELPKLNGHLVQGLGQVGNTRIIGVSVTTVEGVDGRTVQIKGEYNAEVITRGGESSRFEHPVASQLLEPGKLSVKGSNRGEGVYDLSNLKQVDIETVDGVKTAWVMAGIGLGVAVVGLLYLQASMPKTTY